MREYRCLSQQVFRQGDYSLVPIRHDDRYLIMKWRNEQIAILRQKKPLTLQDQDLYFAEVIPQLFNKEKPQQLLFSFLHQDICIGYGGIVHIDWEAKTGEVSFLLETRLNRIDQYIQLFNIYLSLIEQVSCVGAIDKLYTYGYDVAEYRFMPLIQSSYQLEALLRNHIKIDDRYFNIRIYGKIIS